jgi:hypothetical protein
MSGHLYISTSPAPSPRLKSHCNISPQGSQELLRRCEQLCDAVHQQLLADVLNVQQPVENCKQYSSKATVCTICACMRKLRKRPLCTSSFSL